MAMAPLFFSFVMDDGVSSSCAVTLSPPLSLCVCVCVFFILFFYLFPLIRPHHVMSGQRKSRKRGDVDGNLFKDRGKGVVVVFFFLMGGVFFQSIRLT